MNEARLTEAEQQSLGRVLMRDHGCIHHQGPNPFLNPCRACMRRVDLVGDWLAARAAAPVEAGGDNARSLLRNKVRFWRGEQKNGPVWALVLRELQSILDSTPDELMVPKWVLDQSREQILRLQATVQEYQQETTDAAAPVEAGLAELRKGLQTLTVWSVPSGYVAHESGEAAVQVVRADDLRALLRPAPATDGGAES